MDFIQSAIDKARKEREARGLAPAPTPRPQADQAGPQPADAAPVDIWDGLVEASPSPRAMERNHIYGHRRGADAASFDLMRTKLLHQLRTHGWRRVAITSPTAACGKTTLALNLALSLSRQPDLRSMLIELDLRRPAIADALGLENPPQFSKALTGEAQASDVLRRIGGNLALAVNAHAEADSSELLQRVETGRIMDRIEQRYSPDVMLFDMPPMLLADDTLGFIDQIDCVILVAAAGSSTMAEVKRCSEELRARCNFLGVVVNKCRFSSGDDAYGYGYGYGYGARRYYGGKK
ncbi:MAG: CpsD/CapB family tyrosine-protein kinase [Alkalilacustris sp.]